MRTRVGCASRLPSLMPRLDATWEPVGSPSNHPGTPRDESAPRLLYQRGQSRLAHTRTLGEEAGQGSPQHARPRLLNPLHAIRNVANDVALLRIVVAPVELYGGRRRDGLTDLHPGGRGRRVGHGNGVDKAPCCAEQQCAPRNACRYHLGGAAVNGGLASRIGLRGPGRADGCTAGAH